MEEMAEDFLTILDVEEAVLQQFSGNQLPDAKL